MARRREASYRMLDANCSQKAFAVRSCMKTSSYRLLAISSYLEEVAQNALQRGRKAREPRVVPGIVRRGERATENEAVRHVQQPIMAHSYTPGLTVTEQTTVRRRRILPLPGTVLVKVGDVVRADTAVARAELPGKVVPLNLANQLGIAPDEINDYLIKKEKDSVQKDDVLAENKPFIKWFKTEIRSPITGKVESVSTITGQILLREPPRILELRGYIDGSIVEVHPDQGVTV